MKLKNISGEPRIVPALGVIVDDGATFTVPDEWAESALYQVWWWEPADDAGHQLAAAHPEWWDHPHVAEVKAAGRSVASKPRAGKTVTIDSSKTGA